jgi:hypothetical protein
MPRWGLGGSRRPVKKISFNCSFATEVLSESSFLLLLSQSTTRTLTRNLGVLFHLRCYVRALRWVGATHGDAERGPCGRDGGL